MTPLQQGRTYKLDAVEQKLSRLFCNFLMVDVFHDYVAMQWNVMQSVALKLSVVLILTDRTLQHSMFHVIVSVSQHAQHLVAEFAAF